MEIEPTGIATQLIEQLHKLVELHGDLPVYALDADTSWWLPIGLIHRPGREEEGLPECLIITTDYCGRPKGDLVKKEKP
jgi:hypothetical protein